MKMKAMRSFRHGTTMFGRGGAVDLPGPITKDLIKRGLIVEGNPDPVPRLKRLAHSGRSKPKPRKED